jgi:hypothetical protein
MQKIVKVGLLVGLVSASFALAAPATADPAATGTTLHSTGPLKRIYLSKTLQCQVNRSGWGARAFFPPVADNGNPYDGACGTFVGIPDGALYGPPLPLPIASLDVHSYRPYQQGVQSHLSSGPMQCVQTDLWGDFVVYVRQTDCYATGSPFYTTAITLFNPKGSQPLVVRLYHVADCRTRGHNKGYGQEFPSGSRIFCTREMSPTNTAIGQAEGLIPTDADGDYPVNTGAKYMEGKAADVWDSVNGIASNGFGTSSSCVCVPVGAPKHNNAMGLEWTITIPANGWRTRYLQTRF